MKTEERELATLASNLGIKIPKQELARVAEELKKKESTVIGLRRAKASLEMFLRRSLGEFTDFFHLLRCEISSRFCDDERHPVATATVKVRAGKEVDMYVSDGNGPIDALDKAIRKSLEKTYGNLISSVQLVDYQVTTLNPEKHTAAKVRVTINFFELSCHKTFVVQGVSHHLEHASWLALRDAYAYCLFHKLQSNP